MRSSSECAVWSVGFQLVVVGLGEDIVLEEEFAACKGAVGADDFDLGLLEVGAGGCDVAALERAR